MSSDYVVGAVLADGLIGPRFAGRYRPSGHPVALEEIPHALLNRPEFVQELGLAGRQAAQISDPHIVAVHDLVRIDSRLYLVTDLGRGRSLAAMLGAEPALPLPSALVVADSVLAALDVAHRGAVVHGDVCPDCVIVDRDGTVRLAELGLAAALAADGRMEGWPAVAPPEGGVPSAAGDLYACGALLRELATGLRPEQAGPAARPVAVEVLIARAVAPAASERFESASEFRAELRQVAADVLGPGWEAQSDLAARVARPLGPQFHRPRLGRSVAVVHPGGDELAPTSDPGQAAWPPVPPAGEDFLTGSPFPAPGAWATGSVAEPSFRRLTPGPQPPIRMSRRRRWPVVAVLVTALLVAVAAVAVLVGPFAGLTTDTGPLRVGDNVGLTVQPSGSGGCDTTFTFTATGSVSGTGTLLYRWEQDQAGMTTEYAEYSVAIGSGDGSFRLTRAWRFTDTGTAQATMTFRVLSPQARVESQTFRYSCSGGG